MSWKSSYVTCFNGIAEVSVTLPQGVFLTVDRGTEDDDEDIGVDVDSCAGWGAEGVRAPAGVVAVDSVLTFIGAFCGTTWGKGVGN